MRGISSLFEELLASQEGICSMELASCLVMLYPSSGYNLECADSIFLIVDTSSPDYKISFLRGP